MRYCGIDVSARAGNQQLCTLHERRAVDPSQPAGAIELVATFYTPGEVERVARTVLGFGGEAVVAVDAPSGRRLDLLGPGMPLRDVLALPAGRYERSRVCDALLFRVRDRTGTASVPVRYTGSVPDPFRDGREVIVTVRKQGPDFVGERDSLVTRCPSTMTAACGTARSTSSMPARRRTRRTPSPRGSARGWATRARAWSCSRSRNSRTVTSRCRHPPGRPWPE